MSNRRIRKTFTLAQENIAIIETLCKRYKISESEVVNQIIAKYAEDNGMLERPRNEGGIFQTKKEIPSAPAMVSDNINPYDLAPIMRDERFIYDDINQIKLELHKISKVCSMLDGNVSVLLNSENSLLHYLKPDTEYCSANKQPHSFITESKAELAEEKRKAQINDAYK